MQEWEYCVIGPIKKEGQGHYPVLAHLTQKGRQAHKIRRTKETKEADVLAMTIAGLGDAGWEMVGCGNIGLDVHSLYFKRPKQESEP